MGSRSHGGFPRAYRKGIGSSALGGELTKQKKSYASAPGDRQRVKVSNREGIANQTGPESCVAHREVRDEALTGEPAVSLQCTRRVPLGSPKGWREALRHNRHPLRGCLKS